ncbi:MAG: hypothetical protein SFV51_32315 [Bryobacteraceae bacterium]|nr:hypothetical protein [Bryobacteraceae bacterium]
MKLFAGVIAIQICAFAAACSLPSTPICNPALLPFQYEVRSNNDRYFATLIPLESKAKKQTFFLSQSVTPLTDAGPLQGGDPAGFIVIFERTETGVSASELELFIPAAQQSREVTRFQARGRDFSLASCDGIFSDKFKSDFPHLFDKVE